MDCLVDVFQCSSSVNISRLSAICQSQFKSVAQALSITDHGTTLVVLLLGKIVSARTKNLKKLQN